MKENKIPLSDSFDPILARRMTTAENEVTRLHEKVKLAINTFEFICKWYDSEMTKDGDISSKHVVAIKAADAFKELKK